MNEDSKPSGGDAAPSASPLSLSITREPLSFAPVDHRAEEATVLYLVQRLRREEEPWETLETISGPALTPENGVDTTLLAAVGICISYRNKDTERGDRCRGYRVAMGIATHAWVLP